MPRQEPVVPYPGSRPIATEPVPDLPVTMHPDISSPLPEGLAKRALREALAPAFATAEEIHAAWSEIADDVTLNSPARTVEYAQAAGRRIEAGTRALDAGRERLRARVDLMNNRISEKLKPPTGGLAAEIRGYMRGLGAGKAATFALESVGRGDLQLAAALLCAPAYLSGLTPEVLDGLRPVAERLAEPDAFAEREDSRRALEMLDRAGDIFMRWAMQYSTPETGRLVEQQARRRAAVGG